ncbi:MAG: winged helix-turn-helix domain-containing protein [Alphaproteobacteria bacterium]|nr:winged helix-turn-helix domain-containing protein [Alphaproteobacteria bacterium]
MMDSGDPVTRREGAVPYIDWHNGKAGPDAASAVALRPQSLAVLKILHANAGKMVTKEEVMAAVWPDVAVTDDSLVQCITEIRKAIGDTERAIIKTLPKRGYIYEPPVQPGVPPMAKRAASRSWGWLALVIVAFAAGVAATTMLYRPARKSVELPGIAVLPFNNLGTDPKGDKFADMMTEDVITDLSHSKDFAVIARNSSDVYKDRPVDVRQVGRELGVKYVLEGSVESLPGRVRATAQLIDAASNSHVWAERFEREGDDVFAVEAEVTNRIATSVMGHDAAAAHSERNLIRRKPPQEWSAYDAYQVGLEASHHMSKESVPKAEEMFTKAIAIDPNFARAHVGLAWVNLLKLLYGNEPPETAMPKMVEEANTAVTLDPDDGEAHAAMAQVYSLLHDQSKMASEAEQALSLAPNNADILLITSPFMMQAGKADLALKNVDKALSLNPTYPFWYNTTLYPVLFYGGDFARSFDFAKLSARAAPVNNEFLAMDAAYLGKMDEAAQYKKALGVIDPTWSAEKLLTNFGTFSGAEQLERLVTGVQKAGLRLCMTKDELAQMPGAVHLPACDTERTKA